MIIIFKKEQIVVIEAVDMCIVAAAW